MERSVNLCDFGRVDSFGQTQTTCLVYSLERDPSCPTSYATFERIFPSNIFSLLAQRRLQCQDPSPEPSQQTQRRESDLLRSCQSCQTPPPCSPLVQPTETYQL